MTGECDEKPAYYLEEGCKYIEGHLFKKEGKWIEYWIVLRGVYLLIHRSRPSSTETSQEVIVGWIEIPEGTKCFMGKKNNYSFPFYIQTHTGKYLFKTESTLLRHQWVKAIELCTQRRSPQLIPKHLSDVNRFMDETDDLGNLNASYEEGTLNQSGNSSDDEDTSDTIMKDKDIDETTDILASLDEQELDKPPEIFLPSNVIHVSSGRVSTSNFLDNPQARISSTFINVNDEDGTNKKVSFHYYTKTSEINDRLSSAPSSQLQSVTGGLSKSVDNLKQLDVLHTLRSNSATHVGSRSKVNLNGINFSRYFSNSSSSQEDTSSLL